MANKIAWDIERFNEAIIKINNCIEVLEEQKSTIQHLQEAVSDKWVSDAGREYAERIDEDLMNLDNILEKFKETQKNIMNANKTYEDGESNMHRKLMSLYQSMSVY